MKGLKYYYGLMKKMMKTFIFYENKWNEHAWLSDKFHIERNLHYEIVMETKFINIKSLGGLVYDATTLFLASLERDLQFIVWDCLFNLTSFSK